MSIAKFIVISCDNKACEYITPMLDFGLDDVEGHEETIRAREGFSYLDVPFSNHKNLYICQKCMTALSGEAG